MYEVHIKGFKTQAEANAFAEWYEGQGEQDICAWLECRKDEGEIEVDSMNTVGGIKKEGNVVEFEIKPM